MSDEKQPACPSCGVAYIDHTGLNGTCNALIEARAEVAKLAKYGEDWHAIAVANCGSLCHFKTLYEDGKEEIARLRELNAELMEAGSGAILAAMAFDQTDRERKENAERERRWAAACEQVELVDAVAGRAAGETS